MFVSLCRTCSNMPMSLFTGQEAQYQTRHCGCVSPVPSREGHLSQLASNSLLTTACWLLWLQALTADSWAAWCRPGLPHSALQHCVPASKPQPMSMNGVIPPHLTLPCIELHEIPIYWLLQPVEAFLSGPISIRAINLTFQFCCL